MTGRFDRLTKNVAPRLSALRLTGAAPRAALARMSPEDRAVGVAVAGVMAGAVGLAIFNPLTGGTASAETPAQAAAQHRESVVSERSGTEHAPRKATRAASRTVAASTVIKLAKSQIGQSESRNGSTKYADWYASTPHAAVTARRDGGSVGDYRGAEWCDMFVSWLSAQTGVKNMGWDAYTVQHASWFEKTHRWGDTAKPGAVVFFDWQNGSRGGIDDIDHVGLVVKDNGNGTITTIEGNTDNAVKEKVRDKSEVVGYGYPDYAKSR